MTASIYVKSTVDLGPRITVRSGAEIRYEPMLFQCDTGFARRHGGDVTREFVDQLIDWSSHDNWIIDTKVVMLMAGWYPCIPGFHHDDVPRSRSDRQPDYVNPPYRSTHVMALAGDPICRTRFALGSSHFDVVPEGDVVYKRWHPEVVAKIEAGELEPWVVPMHKMVRFDDRSWHEGQMATDSGWRWFGRASTRSTGVPAPANEIRRQTQVYLPEPMQGW